MKLDSFYVDSYRGIRDLELKEFANVNVFVGQNNSGKTSLLEAMVLSGLFDNAALLIQTLSSRYQKISIELLKDMFNVNDDEKSIVLRRVMQSGGIQTKIDTLIEYEEGEKFIQENENTVEQRYLRMLLYYSLFDEEKEERKSTYRIDFRQENSGLEMQMIKKRGSNADIEIPCEFISFSRFDRTNFLIKSLDEVLEQDKRDALIEVLRIFDPEIRNFEVVGEERNIKIFRENDSSALSLYDYGNGMYKAFYIASAALLSESGLLLIDEIEAGIHKEALRRFISYLLEVCKEKDIQLFVTTHSLETLDLFLEYEEQKSLLEQIAVYNIRNKNRHTVAKKYTGNKLMQFRREMGLDVR